MLPNPLDGPSAITPWITIYEHKNDASGNPWPVKSSGNLIRNNISAREADGVYAFPATAGTRDHNIVTTAYSTYFTDLCPFRCDAAAHRSRRRCGHGHGRTGHRFRGRRAFDAHRHRRL